MVLGVWLRTRAVFAVTGVPTGRLAPLRYDGGAYSSPISHGCYGSVTDNSWSASTCSRRVSFPDGQVITSAST